MALAAPEEGPGDRLVEPALGQGAKPPGLQEVPDTGGPTGPDLSQAVAVLRGRVDEEFKITERLDTKQRQAFALAAGLFAVAQTVAFGAFSDDSVDTPARILIAAVAAIAAACVVWTAGRLQDGEELQEQDDINPESIVNWCNEPSDDPDYVTVRLVRELSVVAQNRHMRNQERAKDYDRVAYAARWAMIATGVELFVAIALRV